MRVTVRGLRPATAAASLPRAVRAHSRRAHSRRASACAAAARRGLFLNGFLPRPRAGFQQPGFALNATRGLTFSCHVFVSGSFGAIMPVLGFGTVTQEAKPNLGAINKVGISIGSGGSVMVAYEARASAGVGRPQQSASQNA